MPARGEKDEKHICPLQLDVIQRAVTLWSNPGDVVLSPFAGIGSEGYVAVREGRRAVLVELKRGYWQVGVDNLRRAERDMGDMPLFAKENKETEL
jgi:DNA modification methylase